MHSRVIQLETNEVQILLGEEHLYDDFVGSHADYVKDSCDREGDFDWLMDVLGKHNHLIEVTKTESNDYDTITFKEGFKQAYLKDKYDRLMNHIKHFTLERFMTSYEVYYLKQLIDETQGFYIYSNDEWETLDRFVRHLPDEGDTTYYCGSTIDYHF